MQLPPQDAVSFEQIGHGRLLLPIQPADQRGERDPQEQRVNHGGRVYRINRDAVSRSSGPSYGTLRGRRC